MNLPAMRVVLRVRHTTKAPILEHDQMLPTTITPNCGTGWAAGGDLPVGTSPHLLELIEIKRHDAPPV